MLRQAQHEREMGLASTSSARTGDGACFDKLSTNGRSCVLRQAQHERVMRLDSTSSARTGDGAWFDRLARTDDGARFDKLSTNGRGRVLMGLARTDCGACFDRLSRNGRWGLFREVWHKRSVQKTVPAERACAGPRSLLCRRCLYHTVSVSPD